MSNSEFVHLHNHTSYSKLDGAGMVEDYFLSAKADEQKAIAFTDHGNLWMVPEAMKMAKKYDIKIIVGSELYQARHHVDDRPKKKKKGEANDGDTGKLYHHQTTLAMNRVGYKNLIKLSSRSFMEGYYYKPRVDLTMLEEHNEGLITTSSCLGGIILQEIMAGNMDAAEQHASAMKDIFGDRFFIELMDHGIPEQISTNPELIKIANKFDLKMIVTNDCHYVSCHSADHHDTLLCTQTKSKKSDKERFRFSSDQHYLKTSYEMRSLFREIPEACDNTLLIADWCESYDIFDGDEYHLPKFPVPDGFWDEADYLTHLVKQGAKSRWSDLTSEIKDRIDYELKVIIDMGFPGYFLILWDLVEFAKSQGILTGPGRGSAAGSAVSYCLGITKVDPIEHGLFFERFLNPSRISMPDIDLDMDSRYRDDLIQYCAEKYGQEKVAQIITYSKIRARNAIKDSARVLDYPIHVGTKITEAIPKAIAGRETSLEVCMASAPPPNAEENWIKAKAVRDLYAEDPIYKEIIDNALGIEGLVKATGVHAAAVVIGDKDLTEYLPIQKTPKNPAVTTQFEMDPVEELGLLKMDFLALRNLDVISDASEHIRVKVPDFDIENISLEDEKTYAMLQDGKGVGVFQLESGGMQDLMIKLKPENLSDIAALVALYRPGPMDTNMHHDFADRKNGRKPVEFLHEDAREILKDTQGLMIYQESMMQIAQKFAGYSLADADSLRKACLPAGSRILTKEYGYIPIEDLMSKSNRLVGNIDPKSGLFLYDEVSDVWPVGEKEVFKIITKNGYKIRATRDHQLLIEAKWVQLKNIKEGDFIGIVPGNKELEWDTVVSIESDGFEECYDFSMANQDRPHAVIEDFWVHNCGKKIREVMAKEKDGFLQGCIDNGYAESIADKWWKTIEPFADYSFNKSHALAYGLVAYQTAYLKANYPIEYLAALLTSVKDDLSKAGKYLFEAKRLGITLAPPDINLSGVDFVPNSEDNTIHFALSAIFKIGTEPSKDIVECRDKGGDFKDFDDFRSRVPLKVLNKELTRNLVSSGAFDEFHTRGGLLDILDKALNDAKNTRKAKEAGMHSMFEGTSYKEGVTSIEHRDLDPEVLLVLERELLGTYLTAHPLDDYTAALDARSTHKIEELSEVEDGTEVRLCGTIFTLDEKTTKKGDAMAIATLQDLTGTLEAIFFPYSWRKNKVAEDQVVGLAGKLKEEGTKIFVDKVFTLNKNSGSKNSGASANASSGDKPSANTISEDIVYFYFKSIEKMTSEQILSLKQIISEHPGQTQIFLSERVPAPSVDSSDKPPNVMKLPEKYAVSVTAPFMYKIRKAFGKEVFEKVDKISKEVN